MARWLGDTVVWSHNRVYDSGEKHTESDSERSKMNPSLGNSQSLVIPVVAKSMACLSWHLGVNF